MNRLLWSSEKEYPHWVILNDIWLNYHNNFPPAKSSLHLRRNYFKKDLQGLGFDWHLSWKNPKLLWSEVDELITL